jgi:hypothetical protein
VAEYFYLSVAKNNKNLWYRDGLHFECVGCGNCCAGPDSGYIWATADEVRLIADFLKMPADELRKKYLKRVGLRITIIEQPKTKDCIFLQKIGDRKQCVIYPVRPNQCRTWPFWTSNLATPDDWNYAVMRCPGMNRGKFYDAEEIEKLRKQTKWR